MKWNERDIISIYNEWKICHQSFIYFYLSCTIMTYKNILTSVFSQWIHKTVFAHYHNSWNTSNGVKHRISYAKPLTTQSKYFISFKIVLYSIVNYNTISKVAINLLNWIQNLSSKLELFLFVIYYQLRHPIHSLVSTISHLKTTRSA